MENGEQTQRDNLYTPAMPESVKKYVVMAAAVIMQVCLGGIYAWSAFVPSLRHQFGYSATETQIIFGTCVCVFSFTVMLPGRLHDRWGPRPLSVASGVLVALGYLGAWHWGGSLPMLWLSAGVVGGLGIAFGYVCPLATAVKWFPRSKGLVCGIAVAGYGGGAVMLSWIVEAMLARGVAVLDIFGIVAAIYGPVIVCMGLLMMVPKTAATAEKETPIVAGPTVMKDRRFWLLFAGMFCGTAPGLAVIGNLKPIALSLGNTAAVAALSVSVLAAGNAAGRVLWGMLYDRAGGRLAIVLMLAAMGAAAAGVMLAGQGAAFLAVAALAGFCYGGNFCIFPAEVARVFGSHRVGSVYAMVLFAQGISAIVGPAMGGLSADLFSTYWVGLALAAAVAWTGLAFFLLDRR